MKAIDHEPTQVTYELLARKAGWAWDEPSAEFRLNDTGEGYDAFWKGAPNDWQGLCYSHGSALSPLSALERNRP